MTESVNTSPFVIKVKKTSSDSWHIENREEASEMHDPVKTEKFILEDILPVPFCHTSMTDNAEANDHDQQENLIDSMQDGKLIPPPEDNSTDVIESKQQFHQKQISQTNVIVTATQEHTSQDCAVPKQTMEKEENMNVVIHDSDSGMTPKRWYTCVSCAFSSLNLIGFLIHVHQTHFSNDSNNATNSTKESNFLHESSGDKTGMVITSMTSVTPVSQNIDKDAQENTNCDLIEKLNPENDRSSGISQELQKPSDKIVCKTESDQISIDKNFAGTFTATTESVSNSAPYGPTRAMDENRPFVNIGNLNVSESNNGIDTVQQQDKMPLVFEKTPSKNENNPVSDGNTKTSPKDVLSNGSRGSKINSIVNNLKEYTANVSKQFEGQCVTIRRDSNHGAQFNRTFVNNGRLSSLDNKSNKTSNIFSGYDTNTAQPAIGQTPQTFSYDQSFSPQQNSYDGASKSQPCDVGAGIGFPRRKQSNAGHFEDLQSLLASGCVTMPNATVLQSIKCSQDTWNHIQEMLHEAFSAFPYLTTQESQSLAQITGLTVKQINTLFVVARLQHGISWEQHEIESARRSLSSIAKNRFQTCVSQSKHVQNSLPSMSTQAEGFPPAFSHLTKEQHAILKWSFTTIPLTTNELNRLEEVTMLKKAVILQYFRQLPAHIKQSQNKSGVKRVRVPSQTHSNNEATVDCIRKLKKSTDKANNYFENSRFSINGGKT